MIHEAIDAVITKILTDFPEFREVRYYKGEFEEGVDWNPIFPIVLLNCDTFAEGVGTQSGWVTTKLTLNCYVAIQLEDAAQKILFSNFIKTITAFTVGEYQYRASAGTLIGYTHGIEMYRIPLTVEQRM